MSSRAPTGVDAKAKKLLFDSFWTPNGWRDSGIRSLSAEDFAYAKNAGLVFDDVVLSHDDVVRRARDAVRAVDRISVADAFVSSLASRRLDLRSALGSFAVFQHLPEHAHASSRDHCPTCGEYGGGPRVEDLNVLNFERLKWGGVRHDQPLYAGFDLQAFSRLPRTSVGADDVTMRRELLAALSVGPPNSSASAVEKDLHDVLKSNKAERDIVVGILGLCGVLGTADHPGFMRSFVPWSARELPPRRFVDMAYPACWWTRADGVNEAAVEFWFGHLL